MSIFALKSSNELASVILSFETIPEVLHIGFGGSVHVLASSWESQSANKEVISGTSQQTRNAL